MLHSSGMPYEKRKRKKKVQEDDPATFVIDVFLLITQKKSPGRCTRGTKVFLKSH